MMNGLAVLVTNTAGSLMVGASNTSRATARKGNVMGDKTGIPDITLARGKWCAVSVCMKAARRNVFGTDYCKDHTEGAYAALASFNTSMSGVR